MINTTKSSPVCIASRIIRFKGKQNKCLVIRSERAIQSLSSRKIKNPNLWLAVWKVSLDLPMEERDKLQILLVSKMKNILFSGKTGHLLFNQGSCKGLGRRLMWLGAHIFEKSMERRKKRQVYEDRVLEGMKQRLVGPNGSVHLSEEDTLVKELLSTKK